MNSFLTRYCVVLLLIAAAATLLLSVMSVSASGQAGRAETPPILQVQALPDGRMVAITPERGGLYISDPGGIRWQRDDSAPNTFLHHVAVGPDQTLYLSTPDGIYTRGHGSQDWVRIMHGSFAWVAFAQPSPPGRGGATVAVKRWGQNLLRITGPQRSDRVQGLPPMPVQSAVVPAGEAWFAATFGHGVFRAPSIDANWEPASKGLTNLRVVTLELDDQGDLYAGTYGGGLFRWQADQAEWMFVDPVFSGADIESIAFGPDHEMLVASPRRGVFLSRDAGQSWSRIEAGLPADGAQSVAVGTDGSLWVGFRKEGLFVSRDGGATWQPRPFAYVEHVTDLVFAPDGTGYTILAGLGLFRSRDGGRQWGPVPIPVRSDRELKLAVTGSGRLFLGSRQEGLWMYDSGGESWVRETQGLPTDGVYELVISPEDRVLAIPSDASGIFERSPDGLWRPLPLIGEESGEYRVAGIVFLPDGRGLAAGLYDLLMSADGGQTWERKRFGQPLRAMAVDAMGTIYSQRTMSTFALRPGSESWESVRDIPADAFRFFRKMGAGQWIAARHERGIDTIVLEDGVMRRIATGLPDQRIVSMAVAPDGSIFAGLAHGMRMSRDGGETWEPVVVIDE